MTNEQKEIIMRLRVEGHGYTAVANIVGLPKDTVKSFCRRNGLAGQSPHFSPRRKASAVRSVERRSKAGRVPSPEDFALRHAGRHGGMLTSIM